MSFPTVHCTVPVSVFPSLAPSLKVVLFHVPVPCLKLMSPAVQTAFWNNYPHCWVGGFTPPPSAIHSVWTPLSFGFRKTQLLLNYCCWKSLWVFQAKLLCTISKVMALNMGFFMQLLFSCLYFSFTERMCADLLTSFSLVTFVTILIKLFRILNST